MRRSVRFLFVLLLLGVWSPFLLGQSATGNIIGHVTDSTGAVVPNTKVTATNPEMGQTFQAVSDAQGIYRFYYLAPATYNLTFQHAGFKTLERPGIVVNANQTPAVNVNLTVGSLVQKVQVTAASPLLETATSTTGAIIKGNEMNTLPIMQRYVWMTMYLMPGVSSMHGFHINGSRARGLSITLDGISGLQPMIQGESTNGTVSTTPNAIEEVKLVSTVLPAEYGHSAGGMLSETYKSGTNAFHFEGEDRYIGNSMLHRAYFNLLGNAPFTYHELSGLVSGPVVLPKIYNGRDKTFFMFGFSHHRENYDQQLFTDVPSDAMLNNGDFSFGGLGYPIYDPRTIQQVNGQWTATQFTGNIVPPIEYDPAIAKFLTYGPWAPANNLGNATIITATGPQQNFGDISIYQSYRYRFDSKVDHSFSSKNRMYARYSQVLNHAGGVPIGISWDLANGGAIRTPSSQANVVISDTQIFGPRAINEIKVGFDRYEDSHTPLGLGEGWAQQLGIPGVSGATFPGFVDSSGSAFYGATPMGGESHRVTRYATLQDNFTLIRGRHSLRMGYEVIKTSANSLLPSTPSGTFYFGDTGYPFTPNTGNDFAAFLLGAVQKATFSTTLATWLPRWWSHALYFQDDWTVSPRLTLNLGVRWEYESPMKMKYGQQSQFDPTATDPVTGMPGAIVHSPGPLAESNYKHFSPRLGGAYRFTDNMVFRGGFGINRLDLFSPGFNQNFEEYTSNVTVQSPVGDPRPAFFLSNGPGPINYNVLSNGTSPFVGTNYSSRSATWYDPHLTNPYVMNWNATYQYQFAPTWLLEITYQGSSGVGLLEAWNINAVPLDVSTDPTVLQDIYQNYQNYVPYPNFGTIDLWSNFGHSTFHSGTIRVQKRFSRNLTFQAFYTKSKAIDDCDNAGRCSGLTYYDRKLEKGRAGYDVADRFVAYATYGLPFGKGRTFMNRGGILNYVLGGWNVTWVQTFQSGTPATFTLAGSPYNYLPGGGIHRPNQIGDPVVPNWTIGQRFDRNLENPIWDINAFSNPAAFTSGSVGRNTVNGPHLVWSQTSIAKDVRIKDKGMLQIRYDINNVFKNPNFNSPSSTVNIGSPGLFGKPTSTTGGWCCIGGQFAATLGVRFLW